MPIPDKGTIYPEFTGTVFRWSDRGSRRVELPGFLGDGFANAPGVKNAFISLWDPLREARRRSEGPIYWEQDTHWNPGGMIVAVKALVERLQPGLWSDAAVVPGPPLDHHGDLMEGFLLQPEINRAPSLVLRRTGPAPESIAAMAPEGFASSAVQHYRCTRPDVIRGRTLIAFDSFIEGAVPLLTPWFEDVTFVHFSLTKSPEMREAIRSCDTLVFASVERLLDWRLDLWTSRRQADLLPLLRARREPTKP
jgi:hypothetical protein